MKFSGNLFKIQTKISASVVLLLGSVCCVSAMTGDDVTLQEVYSPGVTKGLKEEQHQLNRAVVVSGQRLDFDGDTELALVDVNGLRAVLINSILTASSDDKITLSVGGKNVETSMKEILAPTDVSKPNEALTFLGYYADGLNLDDQQRMEYLEALLEQEPESFVGENINTAWSFLEKKVDSSANSLPEFLRALVRAGKVDRACIQKFQEDSCVAIQQAERIVQQNILLKKKNQELERALKEAQLSRSFLFNSGQLIHFYVSGWLPVQTAEWLQSMIEQCLPRQGVTVPLLTDGDSFNNSANSDVLGVEQSIVRDED